MNEPAVLAAEVRAGLAGIEGAFVEYEAEFGSKTTYRVGGRCSAMITCHSLGSLGEVLELVSPRPIYVLGNGSNTLVSDRGWEGIVLRLLGDFEKIKVGPTRVRLGAAVSLPVAARKLASLGLGGMEWAVGIPGTVGGAVKMNAGGHGSEAALWLESAEVYRFSDGDYHLQQASKNDLGLRYRGSNIADMDVVASASFNLVRCDEAESRRRISEIVSWRRKHQPGGQNAGSVFVNPDNDHAARLIESIGLKGFKYRTAEVSQRHANFIQSSVGGSGDDVFELIWLVEQRVEAELGVRLRTEIKLIGFDVERSRHLRGE
ncbi:MAG: UDP-N-acetylmuramate dehydrogenase [Actinomycetota bacterium]|nr:UDP-N-acetylmuramate dehydrogenase [Actinomycetota bacterium]